MRGKGYLNAPVPVADGITPAYAGKSFQLRAVAGQNLDHPRVCGEKTKKIP